MNTNLASAQIEVDIRGPNPTTKRPDRPANKRTLRALGNITKACDHLDKLRTPITLAAVATFTAEQEGGPGYGGLRNNKRFTAYISARASEQGLTPKEKMAAPEFPKTGDPQIDANIAALRSHNQMLQKQVRDNKRLFRELGRYDIAAAMERGELVLVEEDANAKVNEDVRAAVAAILDPAVLGLVGLQLDQYGHIINERRQTYFLKRQQVDALRQLVTTQGQLVPSLPAPQG